MSFCEGIENKLDICVVGVGFYGFVFLMYFLFFFEYFDCFDEYFNNSILYFDFVVLIKMGVELSVKL